MRLALLLLLLSLFDPQWGWAGNRFHERNHTGLLVLYGFDDGQRSIDLHPTTARDYTGLGLLGNLTTSTSAIAWNADRAGFTMPFGEGGGSRAVSQRTVAALTQHLNDEVSIEFFISNPTNLGGNVVIAGFGDWPPGSPFPTCDSRASTVEGGWRMYSALGNSIRIQVLLTVDGVVGCFEVSFVATNNVLRHCVIRVRNGEVSFVSHNGIDIVTDSGIALDPALWKGHLTFAVPQPTEGWMGSIFMTAIYNRYFSTAEVAQNRNYGPPNSLPVASAASSPLATTEDVTTTLYP